MKGNGYASSVNKRCLIFSVLNDVKQDLVLFGLMVVIVFYISHDIILLLCALTAQLIIMTLYEINYGSTVIIVGGARFLTSYTSHGCWVLH